MDLTRKVFFNKNNKQLSVTLPKDKFKKKDGIPFKIKFKIEKISYLPVEKVSKKKDLFEEEEKIEW